MTGTIVVEAATGEQSRRNSDAAAVRNNRRMAYRDGSGDRATRRERFRDAALPHLDDVYTLARYLLRNAADAEDAAQECYLRAFRHFETFRGGPIKPWLFAILRNVCRAEYARRGALAAVQWTSSTRPTMQSRGCGARRTSSPETETLLSGSTARRMQRLIAQLPDAFREVHRAARDQRSELSRDRRRHRRAGRHGDVAAGARARAVARGLAGGGEGAHDLRRSRSSVACADRRRARRRPRARGRSACRQLRTLRARARAARELRQALRGGNLRYTAPASLRAAHRSRGAGAGGSDRAGARCSRALRSAASLSAAAAASVALVVLRDDRDQRILGEAISAHLRSLQADHLTDVLSTDQHTVKPWFNGRIDLAPPVIDLDRARASR